MHPIRHKQKKKGFFRLFFLFLTVIFALSLIFSYLASYISPDKFWIFAFFGFCYPFLLLFNLIILFYWLLLRKIYLFIPLIIIISGWTHLRSLIGYHTYKKMNDKESYIKIISYNVRNFDLYNYKPNWEYNFDKRNKIFDFIKKESADILCFQEFFYDVNNHFSTLDTLLKFQKAIYYTTEYTSNPDSPNKFGIATFSAFPIVHSGVISFGKNTNNTCIFSDVVIKEDTVRIYNVHFESIKLGVEDHKLAEDLSKLNKPDEPNSEIKKKSARLLKRMKNSFIIRAKQVRLLTNSIENCRYPIILCGDFNDTPTSYVYHLISSRLIDSFTECGKGFGQSYVG